MTLEEFLDMGFELREVVSNVQQIRKVTGVTDDDMTVAEALEFRNYDSDVLEQVYDLSVTGYDLYYRGGIIIKGASRIYLVHFIENKEYLNYMK